MLPGWDYDSLSGVTTLYPDYLELVLGLSFSNETPMMHDTQVYVWRLIFG